MSHVSCDISLQPGRAGVNFPRSRIWSRSQNPHEHPTVRLGLHEAPCERWMSRSGLATFRFANTPALRAAHVLHRSPDPSLAQSPSCRIHVGLRHLQHLPFSSAVLQSLGRRDQTSGTRATLYLRGSLAGLGQCVQPTIASQANFGPSVGASSFGLGASVRSLFRHRESFQRVTPPLSSQTSAVGKRSRHQPRNSERRAGRNGSAQSPSSISRTPGRLTRSPRQGRRRPVVGPPCPAAALHPDVDMPPMQTSKRVNRTLPRRFRRRRRHGRPLSTAAQVVALPTTTSSDFARLMPT